MGDNRGQSKFAESMRKFILKASEEIAYIQAEEGATLSIAHEVAEYFLSDSSKEEANPFRVFLVLRDFLAILDNACEEVGRIKDGMINGLSVNCPAPARDDGCSR
ncbi:hypothetical protein MLD38_016196 [Melastoma candidum]|nr:hypothetical protein MLD38_016196 [Melastoma candidum]